MPLIKIFSTLAPIEFDPVGFLRNQAKLLIIDEAQRASELFLPIKAEDARPTRASV